MTMPIIAISPRQTFEDNMRPAELLLDVYRLLIADDIVTEGDLVDGLRDILKAPNEEDLMLIYNGLFLGLVREKAQLHRTRLKRATLNHLLRQSIVASSTALETFLPALLKAYLPVVIRAQGRYFFPNSDQQVKQYFRNMTFSLDETMRLLGDENAAERIAEKLIGFVDFTYLSSERGIHVVGALLGISNPSEEIAQRLARNKDDLMKTLKDTIDRRNDIVHRADRARKDENGDPQDISYSWTQHAVDSVKHVCMALNELVTDRITEIQDLMGK